MEEKEIITKRMKTITSSYGRARMNMYMFSKRLTWRVTMGFTRFLKRTFDLCAALLFLIILSPLFLVVAFFVKWDGGQVFFKQRRVGLRGKEFGMLKFRSMCVDAEDRLETLMPYNEHLDGIMFKMKNDPRITPVGRVLRKLSIDELPQLINVIKGEMSLVGPRPPLPKEVQMYSLQDRRRLLIRPGITCLWQIGERNGRLFEFGDRNSIGFAEQVDLDVRYMESQSVFKDLVILLKTIPVVFLGKGGI